MKDEKQQEQLPRLFCGAVALANDTSETHTRGAQTRENLGKVGTGDITRWQRNRWHYLIHYTHTGLVQ